MSMLKLIATETFPHVSSRHPLQKGFKPVRPVELEAEDRGGQRLAVVVEAQAARHAAAERAVRDKVECREPVDRVALHCPGDYALIEGFQTLRRELFLQARVELGRVRNH